MDIQKFKESIPSIRMVEAIDIALEKASWFDYNQFVEEINKKAILRNEKKPDRKVPYQGSPCRSRRTVKFLIKIGFILVDPDRGLKVNEDFMPLSQK